MKTYIHVNQYKIKAKKTKVITIKTYKNNVYTNQVNILDGEGNTVAIVKYSPEKPLSCGAKVWIECDSENVQVIDG